MADMYLAHIQSRKDPASLKTQQNYKNYINLHVRRYFKGYKVSAITAQDVCAFLDWLSSPAAKLNQTNKNPYSQSTVRGAYIALYGILRLAEKWEYIGKNPCDLLDKSELPKKERREAHFYDDIQIITMLNLLDDETDAELERIKATACTGKIQPFTLQKEKVNVLSKQLLIYLAIHTGARRGEILGLDRNSIDFTNHHIEYNHSLLYTPDNGVYLQEGLKTQDRRNLYVVDEMLDMIRDYIKEVDILFKLSNGKIPYTDLLFFSMKDGKHCKIGGLPFPDAYSEWFRRFLIRNDLPIITFHQLRHSSISYLLNSGVEPITVMRLAGHSTLEQIQQTYGHIYKSTEEEASRHFIGLSKSFRQRRLDGLCPVGCDIVI